MLRRTTYALATVLALALSTAGAKPPTAPASAASSIPPRADAPPEAELVEHGHYINKGGTTVHSPAHSVTGQAPAGASAKCRDGAYSFSQHHQGTCSHHGGVEAWLQR